MAAAKSPSLEQDFAPRPYRLLVQRYTASPSVVVDVGCADGFFTAQLQSMRPSARTVGLELDESLRLRAEERGIDARRFDADTAALPTSDVQLLFAAHVIEHLHNPERLHRIAYEAMSPEGILIVISPNASGICSRVRGARRIGRRDATHVSLCGAREWSEAIQDAGFDVEYLGSSRLNDLAWWLAPLRVFSKMLFVVFGFAPWLWGNSVAIVARMPDELAK